MTKEDSSPELKRGEIKGILINSFQKHLPDFTFSSYKGGQYNFQRTKQYKEFTIWETLHVLFLLSDKNFSCSISSRLNKNHSNLKSYNTGLINPHIDLITLKKGTGAVNIEEASYFHNGKVQTTTNLVNQIANDFLHYGIPFLHEQFNQLLSSQIINVGLEHIKNLKVDPQKLRTEIDTELKQVGYITSRLTHPIYFNLKETLQNIPNQTREDRQHIPSFSYELIELLWSSQ